MEIWFEGLPDELKKRAFEFGREFAWSRDDALQVIEYLTEMRVALLGIDIWVPQDSAPMIPTPYVYDWTAADSDNIENLTAARAFIKNFD